MKKTAALLCVSILIFISAGSISQNKEIIIDDFKKGLKPAWQEKSIKGKTLYSPVTDCGVQCLKAESNITASALYYEIKYDLEEYPFLEWSWKVENVLAGGNGARKEGCDFPARIYVVFPSVFMWKTKALSYFWASSIPEGKIITHPYSKNTRMIAVESGNKKAGKWITEKRNTLEDYKNAFGEDPPAAGAVAIITDTDNTKESVTAWYGPIKIMKAD